MSCAHKSCDESAGHKSNMAEEDVSKPSGVLIFTDPQICLDCMQKESNTKTRGFQLKAVSDSQWRKSALQLSGNSFVVRKDNQDVELTDESNIQLEYDPLEIQESVCFYLESQFRNGESSSFPFKLSFISETNSHSTDGITKEKNLQKEFEDVQSASQRLLVENSAGNCSISSDDTNRGVKRKNDEIHKSACDPNTHQLTMEDIYTQEKYPSASSDSCSPVNKENFGKKSLKPTTSRGSSDASSASVDNARELGIPPYDFTIPVVCEKLTVLKECTQENSLVNILFVVIQVNDTREVKVKSGINAGSFVVLSSLVVMDESKASFKVTLWREASSWTEKITPGDFAVATSIKVGKWRDEYVGQTTYNSGFYNLHQPKRLLSDSCLKLVSQERFDALVKWVTSQHPYLLAAYHTKREVEFTEISHLRDNTLVHFRGKLTSVHRASPSSSTYHFGGQQLTRVTAVLEESDKIELFLWGRQAAWMNQLQEGLGQVWEFQFLTAKYSDESGCVSLHSNPRSTKSKLSPEDKNALAITSRIQEGTEEAKRFASLRDLLEAKYSGLAEVETKISSLQFCCQDEIIIFDQTGSTRDELKSKLDKLVYIGCGSCSRLLIQDQNGVYGQCTHCVVTNLRYKYTIGYYYKPLIVCLSDSHVTVEVEAYNSGISRLFGGFPAKTLLQRATITSTRDHSYVDSFVENVEALLAKGGQYKALIACRIALDENSFIENRSFTLQKLDALKIGPR